MPSTRFRARRIPALGLLAVIAGALAGCQPDSPLARAGVEVSPPSSWRPVAADTWAVPGVPLGAWAGPEGSSLVVYRSLPVPGGTAVELAEALTQRLTNLPGLKVVEHRTETRAGRPAGHVEAVAPGTGAAFAPTATGVAVASNDRALVPTRLILVTFPGTSASIHLAWHTPEGARSVIQSQIEQTLDGLRLAEPPLKVSSY